MKNKKVLFVLVSILFSLTMMFSFSFSAFATGEPYNPDTEVTSEPFSEEVTEPYTEAPTEEETEAPTQEQTEEQSEESTESYTQSEVDTLPEVESGEVVVPTAVFDNKEFIEKLRPQAGGVRSEHDGSHGRYLRLHRGERLG